MGQRGVEILLPEQHSGTLALVMPNRDGGQSPGRQPCEGFPGRGMGRRGGPDAAARIRSFPPVAAGGARRLILGSMPGVASLQAGQYYAHPRNLFWPFVGEALGFDATLPYDERLQALQAGGVALWDVLESCERPGSLDSAIDNATRQANDFARFFAAHAGIRRVLFNGATAEACFRRDVLPRIDTDGLEFTRLPSTSPANAGIPLAKKKAAWSAALRLTAMKA